MGRPTAFTPELGERVCMLIAEGASVAKVGRMQGMPSHRTIYRWLATADAVPAGEGEEGDTKKSRPYDAFRQQYLRAREIRADSRFESVDSVIEDMRKGRIDANQARVQIDAIKWQVGKENAKRYGDAVTLRGDKDNPVQVQQRTTIEMSEAELHAVAAKGLDGAK